MNLACMSNWTHLHPLSPLSHLPSCATACMRCRARSAALFPYWRTDPCNCKPSFTPFRRCTTASRAMLLLGSIPSPKSARSGSLRPPAEPVLARAGGCTWRGGAGLHRGQARDVPAASCGAVGHHRQMRYCGRVRTSIRNAEPNDIGRLLARAKLRAFCHRRSRRSCTANSSSRKPACPSRSCPPPVPRTRMVAREADRSVPRYSLIRGVFFTSKSYFQMPHSKS